MFYCIRNWPHTALGDVVAAARAPRSPNRIIAGVPIRLLVLALMPKKRTIGIGTGSALLAVATSYSISGISPGFATSTLTRLGRRIGAIPDAVACHEGVGREVSVARTGRLEFCGGLAYSRRIAFAALAGDMLHLHFQRIAVLLNAITGATRLGLFQRFADGAASCKRCSACGTLALATKLLANRSVVAIAGCLVFFGMRHRHASCIGASLLGRKVASKVTKFMKQGRCVEISIILARLWAGLDWPRSGGGTPQPLVLSAERLRGGRATGGLQETHPLEEATLTACAGREERHHLIERTPPPHAAEEHGHGRRCGPNGGARHGATSLQDGCAMHGSTSARNSTVALAGRSENP